MTNRQEKVIITCAVTGSVHTPTMSEHLPLTPAQIAEQAIEAAEAGAAILHLHARDPRDGRPTADPAVFDEFIPRIRDATDAVINITTGGSTRMTLEERLAYPLRAKPEMCSLNMGSMNFSIHPAARRISEWKHGWEKPYIEGMEDLIFRNTFRDIRHILKVLGEECGTRFEFECYDMGHLYNLAHFVDEGLIKGPLFIQSIFGILGGMGPDPENLVAMKTTADRLFGRDGYRFSVLGAGRHQMPLVTMGAILGGNVRVGLEDSLYLARGQLAKSCAEQVGKIRRILSELSLDIATPAEARAMLGLKGADAVAF
ncbi:BKACE family enzyme [Bordetella petrii]|nr:3-keto-5-aminohexanoate cleavage protein [Bordetella petrii]